MPRYEFSEGTSNKFWEIAIEGKAVTTRWGRIGTDGQSKTKTFPSEAAAKQEHDSLVAEKTKKGYTLVGGKAAKAAPAPAPAKAEAKPAPAKAKAAPAPAAIVEDASSASGKPGARYFEFKEGTSSKFWEIHLEDTAVHTRYGKIGADGQTTVKEFESQGEAWKELEKLVSEKTRKGYQEKTAGAPKSNPALEAAIDADPDDAQAYLVYADWLQEQGDPRGELVTLQHAAAAKKDKKVAAAAEKHLQAHAAAFLGPLAPWTKTQDGRDADAFTWKNGFIYAARLSVDEHGDSEFEGELDQLYNMLVGQPSGRFLVELRVGMNRTSYDNDQQPLIDAMVKKPPRALRTLHFGDFEPPEECEVSWYNIGKLGKLWKAIPQLRHLILHGGSWTLGDLELPEARTIALKTGGLSKASGDAVARATIPKVEELEIWYGTEDYSGGCGPAQVSALLARTDLPALRKLGLKNADFGDEICKVVGKGKLLKQLTHLDLSMSVLTDDGARALAASKDALAHLQELNISDTYVTDEGVKLLKGCAKKIVAEELRDDDDPEYRFVSVGE